MTSRNKKSPSSPSSKRLKPRVGSTSRVRPTRKVALAKVKDDLSRYLRLAEQEEIVITRHGKAAGVLIGFENDEDWFEYRLVNHPEFLKRIDEARASIAAGRGVRLEDIDD